MDEEFNWLEYSESVDSAATESEVSNSRRGLRRFLPSLPRRPRIPRLPSLPRVPRPRLPSLPRLPRLRRGQSATQGTPASASDLLGGQLDRPVGELDDRLRALRERSGVSAQPTVKANQALYDVDEVLVTPEFQRKPGGVISAVALSKAQQQQVELLKDIVGGPVQSHEGGGNRILRPLPVFSLSAAPRLVGTALLMLAVCLPFVSSDFSEGELPPSEFGEDRPYSTTVYNLLDNLSLDDYVLVAFEYGPTAAGELDMLADLILRHILAQGAKPIIVSSNPIAVVHAQNIINEINLSAVGEGYSLDNNSDYYILRYLPGGALGLRELRENFADVVRVSAKGELTGLEFSSLHNMTQTVLIAESAEDVRNWAEQVLPLADNTRLITVTGYAAKPLAQAYVDSTDEILGLIAGIHDAFTYGEMLQTTFGALSPGAPAVDPVVEPLVEPVSQANGQDEAEVQVEDARATAMPQSTATPQPSATPFVTATPQPTATILPTDTPAPTATEATIRIVEVTSQQRANIRRGPTTVNDVLALGYTGDTFEVLGTNGDASWYNILLPSGVEGWIAAFLVEERVVTVSEFSGGQANASASAPRERTVLRLDFSFRLGKNRPRFYQVNPPVRGDRPELALLRDRSQEIPRLEAMTMGTLGAVLVIVIGNLLYAARALLRRRDKQGK